MSIKPRTVPSKLLAQNLASNGATMYLNNTLDWGGDQLAAADFGTQLFAVLRNSLNTQIEIVELDPATVTSAAAITILKRGLGYDGSQIAGTEDAYDWNAFDTIVEMGSDTPQLIAQLVEEAGAEVIAGLKTFSTVPKTTGGNPIDPNDLTQKAYVDSLLAGIASTISLIVGGTAGETVTDGQLLYYKSADGRWWKADADASATSENVILGIAQGAGTAGNAIANGIMLQGIDDAQSGLVAGTIYYVSNTAGGISSSAGTKEVVVGMAKSATELYFNPRFNQGITEDEQDALGGTVGTPSASNKYVTNDDTDGTGDVLRSNVKFGGTGADGALSITSGTTNLDMSNAKVFIKNYTSISITGTGKLTFTNPNTNGTIVVLKSQGNVTLTSNQTPMIDASSLGGAGGAAVVGNNGNQDGNAGSDGTGYLITITGGRGTRASQSTGGTASVKPQLTANYGRYFSVAPGSGGASGGSGGGPDATTLSGAGGRGGGALIIECAGAWNFTTASGISVAGAAGGNANNGTDTQYGIHGGGGGGGGCFLALYNTLTANSGSVTVSGGAGGNQASAGIGSGLGSPWGASGGGSVLNAGTSAIQGNDTTASNGAAGATGIAIVAQNFDIT